MKEKISRNKISRHYKSFFGLENMGLGENDNLMIDWGESLVNDFCNQEVEKRIAETVAMYGWICPRCGAVHSPFELRCDCPPPVRTWISSGTGEWSVLDGKTKGGEG